VSDLFVAQRTLSLRRLLARLAPHKLLLTLVAPALALLFAALISAIVLVGSGASPLFTYRSMLEFGLKPDQIVNTVNQATTYYLAAIAVAIGFRMNLFNIGVDGQYRLAALLSAFVGGAVHLPAPLHVALIVVVAVTVGAAWASIAGILKVFRGVNEVISTIMLNAIATALGAYLLTTYFSVSVAGSNNIGTKPIGASGRIGGIAFPGTDNRVFGLVFLAVLVGVGFHFLVNRSRFGFDLRATGLSASAAVASGVSVRRMVLLTMAISGGLAGLIGMPQLLGSSYSYSLDFPAGLGFAGIGIALLGRNNPVGIAFGALLFGFLDQSSQILDLNGIPKEIVLIMQGTIVLSVVVAYEIVRRVRIRQQQSAVGTDLATPTEPQEAAA